MADTELREKLATAAKEMRDASAALWHDEGAHTAYEVCAGIIERALKDTAPEKPHG